MTSSDLAPSSEFRAANSDDVVLRNRRVQQAELPRADLVAKTRDPRSMQSRIGLYRDDPETLLQVEMGVLAFVKADVV